MFNFIVSDIKSQQAGLNTQYASTAVYNDVFAGINNLKLKLSFKNDAVINFMVDKKELVSFLNDSLDTLHNNGHLFAADLDLYNDGESEKLLFAYHPFLNSNSTNISNDNTKEVNKLNSTYKEILNKLFKYSVSTRQEVVVDEQIW